MVRQWVFDFDDTLVKTGSRVFLTRADGMRVDLTPAQFAAHVREPGDTFDYSEFGRLIDPRPVRWVVDLMRAATHDTGSQVAIVSARSVPEPIEQFLVMEGFSGVEVFALDDADPAAKAAWVSARVGRGGINELHFYDDSRRNVDAVAEAAKRWPHVMTRCTHVA